MFFGDTDLIFVFEIIIRTSFMYLYTLTLVRLLGKRGMGQLSPFEMVIIVALGSAVGDPMFTQELPLIDGVVVITVVVALERLLVKLTEHNRRFERLIESSPVLLIKDGEIDRKSMEGEELSESELFMALREAGIEHLGEIHVAFLEPNGKVSVFRSSQPGAIGRSVLPTA
jgi:uncharacterized membrane protein YcaP (DUF421 family)